MQNLIKILSVFPLLFYFISCGENGGTSAELDVDETVKEHAAFGFEMNELVNTSLEMGDVTAESNLLQDENLDPDIFPSLSTLKKEARSLMHRAVETYKSRNNKSSLVMADSVVIFQDDTTHGNKLYLGYNTDSGVMRLYSVKYDKFFAWQQKTYDSTEIKVNYNYTIDDDSDDKLISLENLVKYKESFFVLSVNSQILVTDYDGSEPSGLILPRKVRIQGKPIFAASYTID